MKPSGQRHIKHFVIVMSWQDTTGADIWSAYDMKDIMNTSRAVFREFWCKQTPSKARLFWCGSAARRHH